MYMLLMPVSGIAFHLSSLDSNLQVACLVFGLYLNVGAEEKSLPIQQPLSLM